VELVGDMDAVPAYLAPSLEAGDVVLVLGAGNINRIAAPLLAQMESSQP
jgi:UDP-N-acetylmuramate-alanine ligase